MARGIAVELFYRLGNLTAELLPYLLLWLHNCRSPNNVRQKKLFRFAVADIDFLWMRPRNIHQIARRSIRHV